MNGCVWRVVEGARAAAVAAKVVVRVVLSAAAALTQAGSV